MFTVTTVLSIKTAGCAWPGAFQDGISLLPAMLLTSSTDIWFCFTPRTRAMHCMNVLLIAAVKVSAPNPRSSTLAVSVFETVVGVGLGVGPLFLHSVLPTSVDVAQAWHT
jgi:hypothetical protein